MALLEEYVDALQVKNKTCFKVAKSAASEGSGLGVWFNGKCAKKEKLLGYSGEVILRTEAEGCFAAVCGNTKWALCADSIRHYSAQRGFKDIALGHMLNHANTKNNQRNNCAFQYDSKQQLLYVVSKRVIDTKGTWKELYVAYNNKKI